MFNKSLLKDAAIFGGLITIILFLVFRKQDPPVYNVSPVKEIETRIQGKETEIQRYNTRIVQDKEVVADIQSQLIDLHESLSEVKAQRDTVRIVHFQDTIIGELTNENNHLSRIIHNQDSIVDTQRSIISSKDTIIDEVKSDLKRVKRQRNISLLINAIQTGIIIFK